MLSSSEMLKLKKQTFIIVFPCRDSGIPTQAGPQG